ncbi:hypothetical protein FA13DRAFT_1804017 [Coprinellus micaceus]|uniref:Uncharacterized protein n=1 Tax=Coprinellus micaceus TaxID=71717 RepID=A0A4Y7SAD1_COPMI|nr:hypothetical protein FA13DRAFT_1804017 [Coprinellus micaceus]
MLPASQDLISLLDFLGFPETERHLLEKHSTRKTILKQRRNELRQQIQGIERDISEEQHQFGVVYNGRSAPNRLPNEILALVFQTLHGPGRFTGLACVQSMEETRPLDSDLMEFLLCWFWRQ